MGQTCHFAGLLKFHNKKEDANKTITALNEDQLDRDYW